VNWYQSYPERDECCEGDGGKEVSGEFIVAGCDTAKVLEPTEGVFNQVPILVSLFVICDGALPV